MRFSQRIGITPVKAALQVESIDNDLKNGLWNVITIFFTSLEDRQYEYNMSDICFFIWRDFFNDTTDTITFRDGTINDDSVVRFVRRWFFKAEWFEIYDFIEFISFNDQFTENCNVILEKEVSGYRIIEGKVVQITSEQEIESIQEALDTTDKWQSVNTHLKAALDFLADKKSPDYRNSIKESISAVESACIKITDDPKATLGKALAIIEKEHSIDGGLKKAFNSIYGYSSNAGGIRHALIEGENSPSFEEAKFMLVSCSAFINYLKAKLRL